MHQIMHYHNSIQRLPSTAFSNHHQITKHTATNPKILQAAQLYEYDTQACFVAALGVPEPQPHSSIHYTNANENFAQHFGDIFDNKDGEANTATHTTVQHGSTGGGDTGECVTVNAGEIMTGGRINNRGHGGGRRGDPGVRRAEATTHASTCERSTTTDVVRREDTDTGERVEEATTCAGSLSW